MPIEALSCRISLFRRTVKVTWEGSILDEYLQKSFTKKARAKYIYVTNYCNMKRTNLNPD